MKKFNPIDLEVFKNRFASICDEMGLTLCRSSFSPNIKERQDFSCAIFDQKGEIIAQAAHIPVHLGSMPLSVRAAIDAFVLKPGDAVILNDPYAGGTHLPDITLVTPVFWQREKRPSFFVANRAHHSDVGGKSPGSMPLARHLQEEGVVIPPTLFRKSGQLNRKWFKEFLSQVRSPQKRQADLLAQQSANHTGSLRLQELLKHLGKSKTLRAKNALQDYEAAITKAAIKKIPEGTYRFQDFLDDDGLGHDSIKIQVLIRIQSGRIEVDFAGSSPQVAGPLNAPYAVTLSATAYVFRGIVLALTGEDCLNLSLLKLKTPPASIVNARYPAPVAGGNVETSQRIVDVLLGALHPALPQVIPAASQGTMNNLAMGNQDFTYYETMAGGTGGTSNLRGEDAIHSHMTNTLNTPVEALENEIPLRVLQYQIRNHSGGKGKYRGGHGLKREFLFLSPTSVSLLTERRRLSPYGLKGGNPGKKGFNWKIHGRKKTKLPAKIEFKAAIGDRLLIETPGGGGFKKP